jgi:hypothetical protein
MHRTSTTLDNDAKRNNSVDTTQNQAHIAQQMSMVQVYATAD